MSRWTEDRGVNDDICYLRQAHLFQRFGVDGLETSLTKDDDRYLINKLHRLPGGWDEGKIPPCHTYISTLNKWVLQYPPGTGFVLALFSPGTQVVPLYTVCTLLVFAFVVLAIRRAQTQATLAIAMVFGAVALYLMINPTKASYSMAPTMAVCAAAGWLTAQLFNSRRDHSFAIFSALGFLLGLSVNFRLANLLLSAGYSLTLFGTFLLTRNMTSFLRGVSFGVGLLFGVSPTLVANAINAGSPFSTTYGAADAVSPQLDLATLLEYAMDPQFGLLLLAVGWTALLTRHSARGGVTMVLAANLAVNILFFATHPVFTPYYTVPCAALSLWTLLFTVVESKPTGRTGPKTIRPE